MKTVDLLKPRYKVIADYPNSPFEVGKILELSKQNDARPFTYMWWEDRNQGHTLYESELKDYPHLFKKLEWFEEREIEDMPKYVKGGVLDKFRVASLRKVDFESDSEWIFYLDSGNIPYSCHHWEPATTEEYTAYISQTKPSSSKPTLPNQ